MLSETVLSDAPIHDLGKVEDQISRVINMPFTPDDIRVAGVIEFACGQEDDVTADYILVSLDRDMSHYYGTLSQIFKDTDVRLEIFPLKLASKFDEVAGKLEEWMSNVMPDQYADGAIVRTTYTVGSDESIPMFEVALDRKPTREERRDIPKCLKVPDVGYVPVKLEIGV